MRFSPFVPWFTFISALALSGCSGDDAPEPDGGATDAGPTITPDGGSISDAGVRTACTPALTVLETEAFVLPLDLYTVVVSGGTGQYRFELTQNASEAIVNPLTGAYLSGESEGQTDVVRVTDEGCLGEASVSIQVVERLELRPARVTALPMTMWTFEVLGGSGDFSFAMDRAGSGGTVTESGLYTAGSAEGTDRIIVTDRATRETGEAIVDVTPSARMSPVPPIVAVPVGQTFELGFAGGSGFVDVMGDPAAFSLEDGRRVVGQAAGQNRVTITDRFTGQTSELLVTVSEPQTFMPVRAGDAFLSTRVVAAGDLNGDGRPDALVGHPEADIASLNDGAVFVYAGAADGLQEAPVQTVAGTARGEELGRAVAVADFDQDGQPDLAVGAPRANAAGASAGVVRIYSGVANGFFETEPTTTLAGRNSFDRFGWAVTACDFNQDGWLDLAASAFDAEDRTRSPSASNQGGVFVFLGAESGFGEAADVVLWGDLPDGSGDYAGDSNLHYGAALSSGDVDGDGACDLIIGTLDYDRGTNNTNDGLVAVHRGISAAAPARGGVSPRPAIIWANQDDADSGGNFGRQIAVADLDGDNLADIIVAHDRFDFGPSDSHGAVRVYRGRTLGEATTALSPVKPADWSFEHEGGFDQIGFSVAVGDVTGDGRPDVVSGNLNDEVQDGPGNAGTVYVFAGQNGSLPSPDPTTIIEGPAAGAQLGVGLAVLGDVNQDGAIDLAAFAAGADDFGVDYGAPFFIAGGDSPTLARLDMPGETAGARFGQSAAIVSDVTGDGRADLVVGAPSASGPLGRFGGEALLYPGGLNGFSTTPTWTLQGFRRHSAFDNFGWGVSSAGDFDGDGTADFAVISRFEDLPDTFDAEYAPDPDCTGTRNNAGAVYVFRGASSGQPDPEPAFIVYGPLAGDGLMQVAGNFDYDGDGLDDLAFASREWDPPGRNNAGGLALVRGRPAQADQTVVICTPDFILYGTDANDQLGRGLAAVGDLDGDGCDEVAAGAPFEDAPESDEGGLRVLYGFGGPGCRANPEMVALRSGLRSARGGWSVASGGDVDGDGLMDIAVGLPNFSVDGTALGAAVVIYGAHIEAQPKIAAVETEPAAYAPFVDPARPLPFAVGNTAGGLFGQSVALVDLGAPTGTVLVAGIPLGQTSGVAQSGGARAFFWTMGTGFIQTPLLGFSGETTTPGGQLGEHVFTGRLNGRPYLGVSGYWGASVARDAGSVYMMNIAVDP